MQSMGPKTGYQDLSKYLLKGIVHLKIKSLSLLFCHPHVRLTPENRKNTVKSCPYNCTIFQALWRLYCEEQTILISGWYYQY